MSNNSELKYNGTDTGEVKFNASEVKFYYVGDCGPHFYTECIVTYWLWRTVPFVLLAVGSVGNILNVVVLSRPQLRKNTSSIFLMILAISDFTCLWTSLWPETLHAITKFRFVDKSKVFCRLQKWLSFSSGGFSVWLLALLTVERTLAIKAPIFSRKHLKPKIALISAVSVGLIVSFLNSHIIFGLKIYPPFEHSVYGTNGSTIILKIVPEYQCFFSSIEYREFFEGPWSMFLLVFYNIIPATTIIIGNLSIAIHILTRRKRFNQVHPEGQLHEGNSGKSKSATRMLFILSFVFLATTLPFFTYEVIKGQTRQIAERDVSRWQLVNVVAHILVWSNYSFNFLMYFVCGTAFKKEWSKLIEKAKRYLTNRSSESFSSRTKIQVAQHEI